VQKLLDWRLLAIRKIGWHVRILEIKGRAKDVSVFRSFRDGIDKKEHNFVFDPRGSCPCYFKYKGFGFCVSELSGRGCQAEKPGLSVDVSIPYHGETITISRASSPQPLQLGQQVIIEAVEGLALGVSPATDRRR
jgi:hypothetical protein